MEKNDKAKKQNFKKQEKKSGDNKKYKKAEVKEKQIAETNKMVERSIFRAYHNIN